MKKNILYLLFIICSQVLWSCGNSDYPPANVRLCYYGEFLEIFGNSVTDEIRKVVDNVSTTLTWDYIGNSVSADSTSFGDDCLRINAHYFADEFRSSIDSTEKIVCLTTYEIFDCNETGEKIIINGITFSDKQGAVVSVASLASSEDLLQDCTRLVLYELAHLYGLAHCNNSNCIMSSHTDTNWINNNMCFCPSCRKVLEKEGWHLNKW